MIRLAEFIPTDPEPVWMFCQRWGQSPDADLRAGVATCLLEHLLEHHFAAFFPRVEAEVQWHPLFADCFAYCWPIGEAEAPQNRRRFDALKASVAAI